MTTLELGPNPLPLNVKLFRNATWWSNMTNEDGNWPTGCEIKLTFKIEDGDDITWPAEISGAEASWNVVPFDVDEVIDEEPRVATLWYVDPDGTEIPWLKGSVQVEE